MDRDYSVLREVRKDALVWKDTVNATKFEATHLFDEFLRSLLPHRWLKSDAESELDAQRREYHNGLYARIVASISIRRRQLSYFQRHHAKLATRNVTEFASVTSKPPKPSSQPGLTLDVPHNPAPTNAYGPALSPLTPHKVNDTSLSETVGSEFHSKQFVAPPTVPAPSSATSSSDVGGLGLVGPFDVPPAPEIRPMEKEKMCPYCCLVLPAKTFSVHKKSRQWKKHILEDLQPYICLFKNCSQSSRTYRTFREWQTHLSQPHYQDWQCPLSHHDADDGDSFVYDTLSSFQDHLNAYHPQLDATAVRNISQAAGQPARLPDWCFVCLAEQPATMSLHRHVANHLEQVFMLALPDRDDIKESDEVSSGLPSSRTALSNAVRQQELDVSDLRGLYQEDSNMDVAPEGSGMSVAGFAAQLSAINKASASSKDQEDFVAAWMSSPKQVQQPHEPLTLDAILNAPQTTDTGQTALRHRLIVLMARAIRMRTKHLLPGDAISRLASRLLIAEGTRMTYQPVRAQYHWISDGVFWYRQGFTKSSSCWNSIGPRILVEIRLQNLMRTPLTILTRTGKRGRDDDTHAYGTNSSFQSHYRWRRAMKIIMTYFRVLHAWQVGAKERSKASKRWQHVLHVVCTRNRIRKMDLEAEPIRALEKMQHVQRITNTQGRIPNMALDRWFYAYAKVTAATRIYKLQTGLVHDHPGYLRSIFGRGSISLTACSLVLIFCVRSRRRARYNLAVKKLVSCVRVVLFCLRLRRRARL